MTRQTKAEDKQKALEKKEKELRLIQLEDVRQAVNHGPTFRWLVRELYDANIFNDNYSANASVHANNAGKRSAMVGLLNEIAEIPTDGPQLVARITGALYDYGKRYDPDRQ